MRTKIITQVNIFEFFTLFNIDLEDRIAKTYEDLKKSVDKMKINDFKIDKSFKSDYDKNVKFESFNTVPLNQTSMINQKFINDYRPMNYSYHSIDGRNNIHLDSRSISQKNIKNLAHKGYELSDLNHSGIKKFEDDDEIHIYLPNNERIEQTQIIDNSTIIASINKLKLHYEALKEKIKSRTKIKKTDIGADENELLLLQKNMSEMNSLIEQLEGKKFWVKEKNLTLILEKERKKFAKEKDKLILIYEEQINKLKIELDKINTLKKELEIKVKMLEPVKIELEKKLRISEQEKKSLEQDLIKLQKEMMTIQSELEKYRALFHAKEKELKSISERLELCMKQKEILEEENKRLLPTISRLEAENIFLKNDNERIIVETQLRINDLKREINDLNNRIMGLMNDISFCRSENEDLKKEIKEERILKEKILLDKLGLENILKEKDTIILSLKKKIEELLRNPPTVIKELPPRETIVEKPVEKIVYTDNPDILKHNEILKSQNYDLEHQLLALNEKINGLNIELNDKIAEIKQWKSHSEVLERRQSEQLERVERIRFLEQENNDLKFKLKFVSDELKRQNDMNQEKNLNMANQIKALNEKNQSLDNILQYYKYRR